MKIVADLSSKDEQIPKNSRTNPEHSIHSEKTTTRSSGTLGIATRPDGYIFCKTKPIFCSQKERSPNG